MEDMGELELKSVIITGADGFVGSYTTEYFLSQGIEVLALGRKAAPVRLKHHDKMVYRQCDITDKSNIIKATAGKNTMLLFILHGMGQQISAKIITYR